MKATTFDFTRALARNHAFAHAPGVDGGPARAEMAINHAVRPLRPAGGAWSNVRDLLAYVSMELAEGKLPDGTELIGRDALLERRKPTVRIARDHTYGMGLEVETPWQTPIVHHGGDLIGFHSDVVWFPEYRVGAVILTNASPGNILRNAFPRKLLELLFDGRPEADAQVVAEARRYWARFEAEKKQLAIPAAADESAKLARRYQSGMLGSITVTSGAKTVFDFGEWKTEVASRKNPDGTVSFVTIAPGATGFDFVTGKADPRRDRCGPLDTGKRTLTLRDAQHEYVFIEE